MVNIAMMGLPALDWLRSNAEVPIHGHRAGLAASMRSPRLGWITACGSYSRVSPVLINCT